MRRPVPGRSPRPPELHPPSGRPADGRSILAANLRRLRRARRLSQEALAHLAGIHPTYLSSVERAQRNIAVDNICRLAWALGVEPARLFARSR